MDVLVENTKREDSWWLVTLEDLHFASWCLCYFFVFLLFVGYGIWSVVFHGMLAPILDAGGGAVFLGFLLFGDAWFVEGREEGAWWREEINT